MKKVKKLIAIAMTIMAICGAAAMFTGCESYRDEEIGDFYVRFYSDGCGIMGTTKEGNNKRFLVIPEYINDVPVLYLGYRRKTIMLGDIARPEIKSGKIEKMFFEGKYLAHESSLVYCDNLKKVIFIKGKEGSLKPGIDNFYYPYKIYKKDYSHIENYYNSGFYKIPANVSYYYNYENSDNYGYYWIDDCDYGGKIEYIPKDPEREGYAFGGWYKEAECVNKWNFDTDTLPEEKTEIKENDNGEDEEMSIYQETILYAKWA